MLLFYFPRCKYIHKFAIFTDSLYRSKSSYDLVELNRGKENFSVLMFYLLQKMRTIFSFVQSIFFSLAVSTFNLIIYSFSAGREVEHDCLRQDQAEPGDDGARAAVPLGHQAPLPQPIASLYLPDSGTVSLNSLNELACRWSSPSTLYPIPSSAKKPQELLRTRGFNNDLTVKAGRFGWTFKRTGLVSTPRKKNLVI